MKLRRSIPVAAVAAILAFGVAPIATAQAGVGFELRDAKVSPKKALFDGKRKIKLRYSFEARRPVNLRIRVVKSKSGRPVRSWLERRARPGVRLVRPWDGVTARGKSATDGKYEFRVGPVGKGVHDRYAGRLKLRGHVYPVDGPHGIRGAVGEFGAGRNGGRIHEGFDITASCGTRLVAARGGKVEKSGYDPVLYGYFVRIDGRKTRQDYFYSHLIAPPKVDKGDRVRTGQLVGKVGQTGNAASTPCHLHFEILVGGVPIDPLPHLRRWEG